VFQQWRNDAALYLHPRRLVWADNRSKKDYSGAVTLKIAEGESDYWGCVRGLLELEARLAKKIKIIVSDAYVHYETIPYANQVLTQTEVETLARHVLAKHYGVRSEAWYVCITEPRPYQSTVVGAIDSEWLAALVEACTIANVAIESIQPRLLVAFEKHRDSISDSAAWFACLDDNVLSALHVDQGSCDGIRSMPVTSNPTVEFSRIRKLGELAADNPITGPMYIESLILAEEERKALEESGGVVLLDQPIRPEDALECAIYAGVHP